MVTITVISQDGASKQVQGEDGDTVMQVIRSAGDELEALCGGCCSCATCHVYIDPDFSSRFPAMTAAENELLDSSDHRTANSRLSCQLFVDSQSSGLRVTIAPAD